MKKVASVLCFVCLFVSWLSTTAVAADEKLTNASVIEMHKLGLGDSVVIEKIKNSACNFDVGLDALKQLKDAGISDAVIQAMISAGAPKPAASEKTLAPAGDPNDPKAVHESGIWLYEESNGKPKMSKLTPSTFQDVRNFTGFADVKTRGILAGMVAALRLTDPKPVFCFYFNKTEGGGLGATTVGISNPDDFALVELQVRKSKGERRLEVGKSGMGGGHMGLNKRDVRDVATDNLAEGIYKVTPQTSLKPGEYAFVYRRAGNLMGGKVYDFAIDASADNPGKR
jgi:hypothetical protein